jgi:hypothetical protein
MLITSASPVKITLYVCPDKECQKKVEEQLAAKEARKLSFGNRRAGSNHSAEKNPQNPS